MEATMSDLACARVDATYHPTTRLLAPSSARGTSARVDALDETVRSQSGLQDQSTWAACFAAAEFTVNACPLDQPSRFNSGERNLDTEESERALQSIAMVFGRLRESLTETGKHRPSRHPRCASDLQVGSVRDDSGPPRRGNRYSVNDPRRLASNSSGIDAVVETPSPTADRDLQSGPISRTCPTGGALNDLISVCSESPEERFAFHETLPADTELSFSAGDSFHSMTDETAEELRAASDPDLLLCKVLRHPSVSQHESLRPSRINGQCYLISCPAVKGDVLILEPNLVAWLAGSEWRNHPLHHVVIQSHQ